MHTQMPPSCGRAWAIPPGRLRSLEATIREADRQSTRLAFQVQMKMSRCCLPTDNHLCFANASRCPEIVGIKGKAACLFPRPNYAEALLVLQPGPSSLGSILLLPVGVTMPNEPALHLGPSAETSSWKPMASSTWHWVNSPDGFGLGWWRNTKCAEAWIN